MANLNSLAGRLGTVLKFNLAVALVGGVGFGLIQAALLLFRNGLSPFHFPNLSLWLVQQTVFDFLAVALGLAFFLALLTGWLKRSSLSLATLFVLEIALTIFLVALLILLKRYDSPLLRGPLAYLAFYLSHWVKENILLFAVITLGFFGIALLGRKTAGLFRIFSWKAGLGFLIFALVLKGAAYAFDHHRQTELLLRDAPNVLLLTVDTLRADHLSVEGYPRPTSPYLDRLAGESVRFTNAMAPWPKTNQSLAGLLTGKYTYATGMGFRVASFLPERNLLLSEILKNEGYRTAGLVSNANLSRYFNFADGFDEYVELWRKQKGPARERGWYDAGRVTEEALQWLEKYHRKKFFLWVHYIDPHTPYTPPAPYRDLFVGDAHAGRYDPLPPGTIKPSARLDDRRDPDYYIAQYDGEIRYTDDQIKVLLDKLDALGLRKNTLLILTADHGESLVENGFYFDHGQYAYENCSRVPLMMRFPEEIKSPGTVEEIVSLTDLFPTTLDFLGIRGPLPVQGHSLKPALLSPAPGNRPDHVFIEAGEPEAYQRAVRTREWKLIATTNLRGPAGSPSEARYELYNVREDPHETQNRAGEDLAVEEKLRLLLEAWPARHEGGIWKEGQAAERQDLDRETLEQLRSLGYIQ